MQIFLSYAAEDAKLASRLATALEQAGMKVWSADQILPGDNWRVLSGEALASSELMVVVFSKNSKGTSSVTRDVQYALTFGNYRGRVVPVLVGFKAFEVGSDVPWVLLRMNPVYLDDDSSDLAEVVDRVQSVAHEGANAT